MCRSSRSFRRGKGKKLDNNNILYHPSRRSRVLGIIGMLIGFIFLLVTSLSLSLSLSSCVIHTTIIIIVHFFLKSRFNPSSELCCTPAPLPPPPPPPPPPPFISIHPGNPWLQRKCVRPPTPPSLLSTNLPPIIIETNHPNPNLHYPFHPPPSHNPPPLSILQVHKTAFYS